MPYVRITKIGAIIYLELVQKFHVISPVMSTDINLLTLETP